MDRRAAASSFVAAVLAAFTANGRPPRKGAIVVLSGSGVVAALTVVFLARFGLPAPRAAEAALARVVLPGGALSARVIPDGG